MKKVQTGQVVEFYSNSCLVKTKFGKFDCVAIKNVVVGDFVEVEIIQDSKKPLGKIIKVNRRDSKISKRIKNQNKLFAANISHVGILVTQIPKTSSEFIDKWLVKANASNIKPFLINNKIDMKQEKNYLEKLDIYKNINIKIIDTSAKYDKNISELKIIVMDRERHIDLISNLKDLGVQPILIGDGDVSGGLKAAEGSVDLLYGIGAAPEGVITATAVKAMGGFFEGRLHFMDDSFKERALKMLGSDINNLWSADHLCRSSDSFFIASGVCSGWIPGVKFDGNKAEVTSKIIFGDSSETQIITNEYILGE